MGREINKEAGIRKVGIVFPLSSDFFYKENRLEIPMATEVRSMKFFLTFENNPFYSEMTVIKVPSARRAHSLLTQV